MMREVLEFVLGDFWHFLGVCILMGIVALWKPVEINVLNGYWKGKKDDAE